MAESPRPSSPTVARTDIDIANQALNMFAAGSIAAFDEDSELAAAVNAVYTDLVETCLGAHPWTFSKTTRQLQAVASSVPLEPGWRYGFVLPIDRIALPTKYSFGQTPGITPMRDFTIVNVNLWCNQQYVWARYMRRAEVAIWPGPFRAFVTTALAARLAIPVTEDQNLAAALAADAWGTPSENQRGGLYLKAMSQDLAYPASEPLYADDPLTGAWMGGGDGWSG